MAWVHVYAHKWSNCDERGRGTLLQSDCPSFALSDHDRKMHKYLYCVNQLMMKVRDWSDVSSFAFTQLQTFLVPGAGLWMIHDLVPRVKSAAVDGTASVARSTSASSRPERSSRRLCAPFQRGNPSTTKNHPQPTQRKNQEPRAKAYRSVNGLNGSLTLSDMTFPN